jgi:hypothetical protein
MERKLAAILAAHRRRQRPSAGGLPPAAQRRPADGQTMGGVTFVNPFAPKNATLIDAALPPIP